MRVVLVSTEMGECQQRWVSVVLVLVQECDCQYSNVSVNAGADGGWVSVVLVSMQEYGC